MSLLRSTLAACLTVICLSSAMAPATAAPVSLPQTITSGFGSTSWYATNTGPAAPFSGFYGGTAGFNLSDATGPTGAGDAYDGAWQIFVNGASFATPGGGADLTGTTLTAGPVAMSGLEVTVQHYYSTSSAVARILVSLRNPGAAAVAASVQVPVNFGSDGGTVIRATSSGDTVVTTSDRWVVSSDGGPSDPVNTSVMYGPGSPRVTPSSYTQTVFNAAGAEGLGASFNLNVPAGATQSLLFFAGLGGVTVNDNAIASAQAAAALFNANPTLHADWTSGVIKSQVVNWSFFTTCAAEGYTGARLSLCRQVCEIDQTPTKLTGLIKLYMSTYRTAPPCAD